MKIKGWVLVLCIFQVLDLLSTYVGIQMGAAERNPVGIFALDWGFVGLIAMKCLAMLAAFGMAWYLHTKGHHRYAKRGIAISAVMMIGVVSWNIAAITFRVLGTQG